jgi:galactose mutarotase-like enzyme
MENKSAIKRTDANLIGIKRGNVAVGINSLSSEICSVMHGKTEMMWGGGFPEWLKKQEEKEGWPHSAIEMFPMVSSGIVIVDGEEYPMQQHGLSRHAEWRLLKATDTKASFLQVYYANTVINSEKGPSSFPFSYTFKKTYAVKEDALVVKFRIENLSEKAMPFAFGYHPAFRREEEMSILSGGQVYSTTYVQNSEGNALLVRNSNEAICFVSGQERFAIKTNLKHIQLWCPEGQHLIAIEPITAPSSKNYQGELKNKPGYRLLNPEETAEFYVKISFDDLSTLLKPELR